MKPQNSHFPHFTAWMLAILATCMAGGDLRAGAPFDPGKPTSSTPYDGYLGPMRVVFSHLGNNDPDLATVTSLVREGKGFRYYFNSAQPYEPQSPEVTEKIHAGDCKAKSLWLAYKMDSHDVRYVIGKARAVSTIAHAWLVWKGPDGWLILDATNFSTPLVPERLSPSEFIPMYSYTATGKYLHSIMNAGPSQKYGDHL